MASPEDFQIQHLILVTAVTGLWSNVLSSPNPLAKNSLQPTIREVDLGYNSTAPDGLNEVVLTVVNLVKVSLPRFKKRLHGSSNVTSQTPFIPMSPAGAANETMDKFMTMSGPHAAMGTPSMANNSFNSTEGMAVGLSESNAWGEPLTCDALQKEVMDLLDFEAALMKLLEATRERIEMHRNESIGNPHQNCFPVRNNTLRNDTMVNLTMNSTVNVTGGTDIDIMEPIISLHNNTVEPRDHQRQNLTDFTALVTTLIQTLQGMGQKVMMMQEIPSKGPKQGSVYPGPIDTVCGDPKRKPSTLAEYVMGKHKRR